MGIEATVEHAHIGKSCEAASVPSMLPLSTTTMSFAQGERDSVRPIFWLFVSRTNLVEHLLVRRVELAVSMFEAVVQLFHLGSDVIPSEMRGGVSSSGFTHRSGEAEVGGQ
jgi:hypothetical protein